MQTRSHAKQNDDNLESYMTSLITRIPEFQYLPKQIIKEIYGNGISLTHLFLYETKRIIIRTHNSRPTVNDANHFINSANVIINLDYNFQNFYIYASKDKPTDTALKILLEYNCIVLYSDINNNIKDMLKQAIEYICSLRYDDYMDWTSFPIL